MYKAVKVSRDFENLDENPFILESVVGAIIPFIMIYGIYILLNGHLSPGGAFSGGTILGSVLVLCSISYGQEKVRTFFNLRTFNILCSCSLGFYLLAAGFMFIMWGAGLLELLPTGNPDNIISGGLILPLSISVGIKVACTIYGFFALFSEGEV